jgi:hypothetical protein
VSHASRVCPQVAGAVRETRPTVPLGLGRWDRFKEPLTCEILTAGGWDEDAEGVPAVLNPRTQRHIERHRNGTGHDYQNGQGCFVGYHLPPRGMGMGVDWHGQQ